MAYRILATKQFNKAVKRCQRRGLPMEKLLSAMRTLADEGSLPPH